ncbi:MAG TPA: DUF4160 domain-containing protein [Ignavibacteria bacterium]|nr:DUF4160 domain-containing protein [Ignavibacteria bacterium]
MPQISRFFGIVISMYFGDHNPPHFHAKYGESEVLISLEDFSIIEGKFPQRALSMVIEWAALHKRELETNWQLVSEYKLPEKIEPLS